jgi:DNA-binding PadR family transcriptional regulator
MTPTTALDTYPAGRTLTADQITEFHAARIMLLIHLCGVKNRIEGLTKLAKLDFFVRYPNFFQRAADHLKQKSEGTANGNVESAMVRHHYGPWDARYYQILAYLESRAVLAVERRDRTFVFTLTDAGVAVARRLAGEDSFQDLCGQMKAVKKLLGAKSGDSLKKLVYQLFEEEVAQLPLGQVIRQ